MKFIRFLIFSFTVSLGLAFVTQSQGGATKFNGYNQNGGSSVPWGVPVMENGISLKISLPIWPMVSKMGQGNRKALEVFIKKSKKVTGKTANSTEIISQDGTPMILVPAATFIMGSAEGEEDELPPHPIYLGDFYMDKYEVTVLHYSLFLKARHRQTPRFWSQIDLSRDGDKPIVGINWYDAEAYCQWVGKRLPTEAEWEKAARGTDGRIYPWGNEPPRSELANFNKEFSRTFYRDRIEPVGSHKTGLSPYGIFDMAGNVWEWVGDWYKKDYYKESPSRNPQGPATGNMKVLRGGSWNDGPTRVRSAYRNWGNPMIGSSTSLGSRCALDANTRLPGSL